MESTPQKALSELVEKLGIRKDKPKEQGISPDCLPRSTLNDKQRALRKKRRKHAKFTRRRNRQ